MKIAELFVELGVKGDDSIKRADRNVDNFVKHAKSGLQDLAKVATVGALAIVGLAKAFTSVAESVIKDTAELQHFNNETGLSIEKLQQWQRAAKMADVSTDINQVTSAVKGLNDKLTDMQLRQASSEDLIPFLKLGIDPRNKDAFGVLDDLREKVKGLNNTQASNLLKNLGLQDLLPVLRMTKIEFDSISNSNLLSTKQRNEVLALGRAFENLKFTFKDLKDQFIAQASPRFLQMLSDLQDWIKDNKENIYGFFNGLIGIFEGLVSVASQVGSVISLMLKPLISIWDNLPEGIKSLITVGALTLLPGGKVIAAAGVAEDIMSENVNVNEATGQIESQGSSLGIKAALGNFANSLFSFIGESTSKEMMDDILTNPIYSANQGNQTTTVNQTININGAQDPKMVAKEVAKHTKNNFDNEKSNVVNGNNPL